MNPKLKQAFERAAIENYWSDADSVSGPGSNMLQTRIIREAIPVLLEKYNVQSMMDAPCGDLFWMKTMLPVLMEKGIEYHGADIVPALIEKHTTAFKDYPLFFHNIDLTKGPVPKVDLIFTRDCFIHLSYKNILSILKNYRHSGSRYLLVNTYTKPTRKNHNVRGFFLWGRMLNMEKFPFYFGKPIELINEGSTEKEGRDDDKSLGLWEIGQLNLFKIKLCLILLFIPETTGNVLENTADFMKRLKNFIKRKLVK